MARAAAGEQEDLEDMAVEEIFAELERKRAEVAAEGVEAGCGPLPIWASLQTQCRHLLEATWPKVSAPGEGFPSLPGSTLLLFRMVWLMPWPEVGPTGCSFSSI